MPAVFEYACMNMHREMTVFMEAVPSDRITQAESETHSLGTDYRPLTL